MLRTQVYLPEELDQELKLLAQKEGRATASLIRELLDEGLRQKKNQKNAGDTLLEIAKLAAKGPEDLSTNFFEYAYGKKSSFVKGK